MNDIYAEGTLPPTQYIAPAVSVRATWSATDGSRPEEVYVDWKEPPPPGDVLDVVRTLLAAGGYVEPFPVVESEADDPGHYVCGATADLGQIGEFAHVHRCPLALGHEPVEPEGRAHRCECGGLFAADSEVSDVPGRGRGERGQGR